MEDCWVFINLNHPKKTACMEFIIPLGILFLVVLIVFEIVDLNRKSKESNESKESPEQSPDSTNALQELFIFIVVLFLIGGGICGMLLD